MKVLSGGLVANRMIRVVVLGVALFLGACASRHAPVPQPLPYARMFLATGEITGLRSLVGKPAVLLFWSTTCTHSGPVLEEVNAYAAEVPEERGSVIAISLDKESNREYVEDRLRYREIDSVTNVYSGNAVMDEVYLQLRGGDVPEVLLVDPAGTVVKVGRDLQDLEPELQQFFGVPAP